MKQETEHYKTCPGYCTIIEQEKRALETLAFRAARSQYEWDKTDRILHAAYSIGLRLIQVWEAILVEIRSPVKFEASKTEPSKTEAPKKPEAEQAE